MLQRMTFRKLLTLNIWKKFNLWFCIRITCRNWSNGWMVRKKRMTSRSRNSKSVHKEQYKFRNNIFPNNKTNKSKSQNQLHFFHLFLAVANSLLSHRNKRLKAFNNNRISNSLTNIKLYHTHTYTQNKNWNYSSKTYVNYYSPTTNSTQWINLPKDISLT